MSKYIEVQNRISQILERADVGDRISRNIDLFLMALVVVNIISITVAGKLIAVGSAILGVIVVALITGIVASAFNAQMERRNIIFED